MSESNNPAFGSKLFGHRIAFFLSRLVAIPTIPLVWLLTASDIVDDVTNLRAWAIFVAGMALAVGPIILFKYIIRLTCPNCGEAKLDREVMGAGNYECLNCGFVSS